MSITTFTLLGDCLSQLRPGMLRYQMGIRKTHLLSVQRGDLTGDQMELCCRSVRHYGSRCPEASHCTLLKEDCGKSQASPDDVPILHHLREHRTLRYRCRDTLPTV